MAEFRQPPQRLNYEGAERRVGVEMEMAKINADAMAEVVVDCCGGELERESSFVSYVRGTDLGDFRIELDAEVLKSRTYLDHLARLGIEIEAGEVRDNLEGLLSRVAGIVVPHELVCPPIALSRLPELDRIRGRLHQAGARGTQSSPWYAFGLQLNVEIADTGPEHILDLLRAFLLRYEDLLEDARVDLTRKLSPYVQPYPEDYVAHVLDPDYAPDRDGLIDDFLRYTPTRNRPLDLLPLFAWLDSGRVDAAPVEHDLIKPRPTWHYRLPSCLIDDSDWSLAEPWNGWVTVEELAAEPGLDDLCRRYLAGSGTFRRLVAGLRRRIGDWFRPA